MDTAAHWDHVYRTKPVDAVSWYQSNAQRSMHIIQRLKGPPARVIDVGAGASVLVDGLLDAGYPRPVALDVSSAGLAHAKERLGARAVLVDWIVGDVTRAPVLPRVDLWHDRAVLHFLTLERDQRAYAALATTTVGEGGYAIIGTFAPDGPERCSGLPVQRHDGASVASLLGAGFQLVEEERQVHRTPSGAEQNFAWAVLRRT
jgi:hypothetical protein